MYEVKHNIYKAGHRGMGQGRSGLLCSLGKGMGIREMAGNGKNELDDWRVCKWCGGRNVFVDEEGRNVCLFCCRDQRYEIREVKVRHSIVKRLVEI